MALPGFLIAFLVEAITTLISYALRPKSDKPQPKGLSDFEIPTADASRAIPVVFGSVKLTGPNVVWYGDLGVEGFQINGQDAGYYYSLGLDLAVCHGPVDSIDGLLFEDKSAGWSLLSGDANLRTYAFDNTMLFGGNTSGGGVKGNADCYLGTSAQPISAYLQSKAHADYPGLSTLCHIVLHGGYKGQYGGVYLGTSPYVKAMAVLVTRCPNQLGLGSSHHQIAVAGGYDANPACMLYELLTDATWGLGLPAGAIDTASFAAAGETLYAEGFGLSMVLEQPTEASETMREILRHIDGGLSADPSTGKLVLKLIREDYVVGSLPVLDQSCIESLEMTRGSWSETYNVARITYTSRADNWTSRVAQWSNLAVAAARGATVPTQVDFRGLSNAHAAGMVAARTVKKVSYPFANFHLTVNRKAWALRQADAFVLNWPRLGIAGMVCRVVKPAAGRLEDGRITMDAIEDSFAVSGAAYTDPPGSQWNDPVGAPVACAQQLLWEIPYQLASAGGRQVGALAVRANSTFGGFQIWSDAAGGTAYVLTADSAGWCPYGELVGSYAANTSYLDATGFQVQNCVDADALVSIESHQLYSGYNLALIDSEIIAWQTVAGTGSTRTITNVLRGVLDTVPAAHSAGAKVWFFGSAVSLAVLNPSSSYTVDGTVTAKLLPHNARGTFAIGSATQLTKTTASRAQKPLPPGNVRIDGVSWPTSFAAAADRPVTWAERNRTWQANRHEILSQGDASVPGGPEGNFTIEVRVGGTLKRTVTAASNPWTWTAAMQATDAAIAGSSVTIRVIPVNGSLVGTYQERGFTIT